MLLSVWGTEALLNKNDRAVTARSDNEIFYTSVQYNSFISDLKKGSLSISPI